MIPLALLLMLQIIIILQTLWEATGKKNDLKLMYSADAET